MYLYVYVYLGMYVMWICICVCVYVCMYVCAYIYIRRYRQLDRYIAFVMSFLMMVRPGVQILTGLLPVVRSHIIDHVHIMWTFAQLGLCPFVLKPGLKLYQKQEHQRGQLGQTFRIMVIGLGVGVEQQNAAPQSRLTLLFFCAQNA